MNSIGNFALLLAWLVAVIGVVTGALGGLGKDPRWFFVSRNATVLVAACSLLSIFILGWMFHVSDFSNQYVWSYSSRDMDAVYRVSAIWGGMDGSMLLWAVMLAMSAAVVAFGAHRPTRTLASWTLAVLNSSSLFFLSIVAFVTNPFRYLQAATVPADGNGLNPLLQNPFMAVHPPTLYVGFTTFAVPAAFCLGALLANSSTNEWVRLSRRWTLVAWMFLTAGITMGGYWAYIELGWGGYWAWDPVENASFLPWLTGTAFLHSVMVQERKNMLKTWNVWLVVGTYILTVFGTFLTRSGIVQSVHSFASTDIGWMFLAYIGVYLAGTAYITWLRRPLLKSARAVESFFSRESMFVVNNLLLVGIMFTTLWGTMFPVFSESITGRRQTVGIPWFNAVNGPLFLLLLAAMVIGPLVAWRRGSLAAVMKILVVPLLITFAVMAVLLLAGITSFKALLAFGLGLLVIISIGADLHRSSKAARSSEGTLTENYVRLIGKHRTKYGGHLVHAGVGLVAIAIAASSIFQSQKEFLLKMQETTELAGYQFKLTGVVGDRKPAYEAIQAQLEVSKDGKVLKVTEPQMRAYFKNNETTHEVDITSTWWNDVYVVLTGVDSEAEQVAFKVFVNPLQWWLWKGVAIMVIGTFIVLLPRRRSNSAGPLKYGQTSLDAGAV